MTKTFDLTYVFGAGRIERLVSDNLKAKEFFYGYDYLASKYEVTVIEMNFPNSKKNFLYFVDKVLRKLTNLPIYYKDILSYKNLLKLARSKKLVFTSELLLLSLLPIVLILKSFKKIDIYVIVMGLFGRKEKNRIISIFQKFYINIFLLVSKKVFFLGKGEIIEAEKKWEVFRKKFVFLPFSVDFKFWNNKEYLQEVRNKILFIGNDVKRDYDLILRIAEQLPEFEFVFITSQKNKADIKSSNINLIKGKWNENYLSEEEIKKHYTSSAMTLIPLKNSYQPSGQSVCLQSMACGTPVIISRTKGFWDIENFEDNTNIIFIDDNDINTWTTIIRKTYNDKNLLNKLSKNGNALIEKKYNLNTFNKLLEENLGILEKK